jgi:hypothetical protein
LLSSALVLALGSLIALSSVHILIAAASRTLGALRRAAALRRLLRLLDVWSSGVVVSSRSTAF